MKLEYEYTKNYNVKRFLLGGIAIGLLSFILWLLPLFDDFYSKINDDFYWIAGFAIPSMMFLYLGLIPAIISFFLNIYRRKKDKIIIENGIKKREKIEQCLYYSGSRAIGSYLFRQYKLLLSIEGKEYELGHLKNNKAYKLVKNYLLFDKYEIFAKKFKMGQLSKREDLEIYIDVYIYNDKIYGDLESINLSKIEKTDI